MTLKTQVVTLEAQLVTLKEDRRSLEAQVITLEAQVTLSHNPFLTRIRDSGGGEFFSLCPRARLMLEQAFQRRESI